MRKLILESKIRSGISQAKASEIIEGTRAPNKGTELLEISQYLSQTELRSIKNIEPYCIKNYWSMVLQNCYSINCLLDKAVDIDKILVHLKRIDYQRDDPKNINNFTISFHFYPNPYLKGNHILKKQFIMYDNVNPLKSEGQAEFRKPLKKNSFFNFFESCNLEDAIDKDPEERRRIEQKMGKDFEIAQLIIEELIPYSLEYYLNLRNDIFVAQNQQQAPEDKDKLQQTAPQLDLIEKRPSQQAPQAQPQQLALNANIKSGDQPDNYQCRIY